MKKMKKSLKLIIALVSVAVLAIAATVITIVIVNNNKRKNDNPTVADYTLTAEQKLLAEEVNKLASTAISDNKLHVVEYDRDVVGLEHAAYFDENVIWSFHLGEYSVDVFDEFGEICMLHDRLRVDGFISSSLSSFKTIYASKNHFACLVSYQDGSEEVVICSVENFSSFVHKRYAVNSDTLMITHNGNKFAVCTSDNYFAVLLKDSNGYYYEFNEYLTDYSEYTAFRYSEAGIENANVSSIKSKFYVEEDNVVSYINGLGFSVVNNSELVKNWEIEKGIITQSKTIHESAVSGAYLDDGKFCTYSYSLVCGDKTSQISLDGYNKISGIVYSSEKYFAVFMQKVNTSNALEDGGLVVYYDYNLNVIAKYEASSSASMISYVDGAKILTADGIFTTKNQVNLQKLSGFKTIDLEFYRVLSNGNFLLFNSVDSICVYNFNLEQVCETSFDTLVRTIDDDNYIFQKQGEYLIYNVTKNTANNINYFNYPLFDNSTLYLVDDGDSTYSLYDGLTLLEDKIVDVEETSSKTITVTTEDDKIISYCLVENVNDTPVLGVSIIKDPFANEPDYGIAVLPPVIPIDPSEPSNLYYPDGSLYSEPSWYDYDDVILTNDSSISNTAGETYTITAIHCIQNGFYSKIKYCDYFEFAYEGQNSGNKTTYKPLRFYYQVIVENGRPNVKSIGLAHQFLRAGSIAGSFDASNYLNGSLFLTNGQEVDNTAYSGSYDAQSGGYYYIYSSSPNEDGSGFQYLSSSSKAEVYGNSIRVTLKFSFKQFGTNSVDFDDCGFGKSSITDPDVEWVSTGVTKPNISESVYYNSLYYQTIVVGYLSSGTNSTMNSSINYYSDIVNKSNSASGSTDNVYPVTQYFSVSQIPMLLKDATANNLFEQCVIQSTAAMQTQFTATVSNKIYYSDAYSPLYVGNIALDLTGGRLIGFTNFNTLEYNSTSNATLYDMISRTYRDEKVVYRAHGTDASSNTSGFDLIDYEYLKYDKTLHGGTYVLNHKNANEIYHTSGGLNKYRYVYCIYEPMTFYVELDYNVGTLDDDNNHGIAGEIDYLKKYAGLDVGVSTKGDYTQYNELWAYNIPEVDEFGNLFSEYVGDHKYATKDFSDNDNRFGDNVAAVTEKQTMIASQYPWVYNGDNYRCNYVTIEGTKYYFSVYTEDNGTGTYKSYTDVPRVDNKIYLIGKKSQLDLSNYSEFDSVAITYAYARMETSNATAYNSEAGEYLPGDDEVILCIDFNVNKVFYREKNVVGGDIVEIYSPILEYKSKEERFWYINIGGVKYYIQRNFGTYTKSYSSITLEDTLYLIAYKDVGDFKDTTPVTYYGNFVRSNNTDYKAGSFSAGDSTVIVCIRFSSSTVRAYYLAKNIHTRTSEYVGHYYYSGGTVLEDTTTEKTNYKVIEKFAFLYTDDVLFTSDPLHTHFAFAGWKVLNGDVLSYENVNGDMGIFIPNYSGTIIKNINPISGKYLAGSLDNYTSLWGNLITSIANDGTITWKSSSDVESSPIKLVAQWTPELCSVDVTLWTINPTTNGHDGVIRNPDPTVAPDDNDYLILGEITDQHTQPLFTVGGVSIDLKNNSTGADVPDGKLDINITFYYNSQKDYKSIYTDISNFYLLESINATGMEWKIAGWVYQTTEGYFKSVQGSNVKIAEFIGDTTKLAINAYYSESNYDIEINLNPMGGALNSESKNYTGNNDTIYNNENSFARYNVYVTNNLSFHRYYLNDDSVSISNDMVNMLTAGFTELSLLDEQTRYQLSLRDGIFLVGNDIAITIEEATQKYYVKRLIFRDVTLYGDDGKFDKFTVVFEYDHYATGTNRGWNVTVTSQTDSSIKLSVVYTDDGGEISLKFGSQDVDKKYNNNNNVFSIRNTDKGIVVNVEHLSNPGTIIDRENNKLNGSKGFILECVLEAYTLRNESVIVKEKENDDAPSDETTTPSIEYNKSIMISAQPLSNVEGKELEIGKPAFMWLGTQRYLFSSKWQGNALYQTGYYLMYNGDQQEPEYKPTYTYELFISQAILKDNTLFVYYDNATGMIYYPNQTNINIITTSTTMYFETGGLHEPYVIMYILINQEKFFFCLGAFINSGGVFDAVIETYTSPNIVTYKETYLRVGTDGGYVNYVYTTTEEAYNLETNYYYDGAEELIVHLFPDGRVEYKTDNGKTGLYPSFNNTRVIAIDPEQENVRFSASYSDIYEDTAFFELKYYISSLKIYDTTFEFDKPTREFVYNTDYYSYSWLNLNHKVSAVGGNPGFTTPGNVFKYLGEDYYIQDSYNWTLPTDDNRRGADIYYFYLTRTRNGFTRYFLIFDVQESDQRENEGNYVDIEIEFSRFLNKLEINVVEEDLYQDVTEDTTRNSGWEYHNTIKKSFGVSFYDNMTYGSYIMDDDYVIDTRKSFEAMKTLTPTDADKMQDRYFYEMVGYQPDGSPNDIVNNKLSSVANLGDVPTLSWGAITRFYPCDTNRLNFKATSGYIIKSFSITFGLSDDPTSAAGESDFVKIISFELDESSFENLNFLSLTGQYSYIDPNDTTPLLKYKITTDGGLSGHTTNQSLGFNIMPSIKTGSTGLMYGVINGDPWQTKSEDTYTLDKILVLLSGLYGNVKIDMTTTSYSEYLFESGGEDVNPLIKEGTDVSSDGSGKAYKYLEADIDATAGKVIESVLTQKTYLDLYTQKAIDESNWEYDLLSTGVDLLENPADPATPFDPAICADGFTTGAMRGGTPTSVQNYIGDKYRVQYYFENDSATGISQGTIRIIFCGTVSRIKGGLHFMATHNDYSVYFTNGKYYNQAGSDIIYTDEDKNDAFGNLDDYAGRTGEDKIIDSNTTLKEITNSTEKISITTNGSYEDVFIVMDGVKYYLSKECVGGGLFSPYEKVSGNFSSYKKTYVRVVRESNQNYVFYTGLGATSSNYKTSYYKKGIPSFYIKLDSTTTIDTTFNYNVIDSDTAEPLGYTNKLLYLSTGPLIYKEHTNNPCHSSDVTTLYDGYFDSEKASYISGGVESNYKFFVSMVAVINTIQLDTSSYLFDRQFESGTYSSDSTSSFNESSLKYKFIDENKLYVGTNGRNVYQLDNTQKTDSWFNDTILTNMQFNSYMDEYDGSGVMTSNPKTWVNRHATNPDISELTSYEMSGYDFNWTYYTIAGYKLKYIMVYLVDLEKYYIIDVANTIKTPYNFVDDNLNTYASFISFNHSPNSTNGKNYEYNFKLEFYNDINPLKNNNGEDIVGGTDDKIEGNCYKFYPVIYEEDDISNSVFDKKNEVINKLKSINIMSNDIKVAFISEPYEYKVQYMNYKNEIDPTEYQTVADVHNTNLMSTITGVSSTPSATGGTLGNGNIRTQSIKYDCMTPLTCKITLPGYTFVGWGSYKYFSGTDRISRYQARSGDGDPVTWNSSSSWYDPTPFFVQSQDGSGNYLSGYQSALNFFTYYSNRNQNDGTNVFGDPCSSFYVSNGYFVTDTGYRSGYDAQNYNFYGDYAEVFSHNIKNKYNSSIGAAYTTFDTIYLFALFKANVYTIQFDVNNEKGDAYYLSLEEKVLRDLAGNTDAVASDWLTTTFTDDKFGIRTTYTVTDAGGVTTRVNRTYYAYITYDTNNWYYSENNGQSLLYAYKCEPTYDMKDGVPYYTSPYVITDIMKNSDLSRLSVDMFGYSWLGWYYKRYNVVNEGSSTNYPEHVLQSSYNPISGYSLPKLDKDYYNTLRTAGALQDVSSGTFVYNGQHKANEKTQIKLWPHSPMFMTNNQFAETITPGTYILKYLGATYYFKLNKNASTKGKYYKLYTSSTCHEDTYASGMYVSVHSENNSGGIYSPQSLYLVKSNLNALDGYVYFYDYSHSGTNNQSATYVVNPTDGWCGVLDFNYTQVSDSLNKCYWQLASNSFIYNKKFTTNIVFSYFDTSLSANAYKVTGAMNEFYLSIDRSNLSNVKYIKLFANWVNNRYTTKVDYLDSSATFEEIGSSNALATENYVSGESFYFNQTGSSMSNVETRGLANYLWDETKQLPYRVGYDFVGWTFSYVYSKGNYANGTYASVYDLIYQPNSELNLNYKLFSQYGVLNDLTGVSPYESNIFILDGTRTSIDNDDWILNAEGKAEHLGDTEGHVTRYIYIFPVWRVQTFSFGVSLNISSENLQNLYDKDSNFAIGLYNNALTYNESEKIYEPNTSETTSYTGVSSKFYTNNTTAVTPNNANGYSAYQNYFNDIVANLYFEIEFDKPIDTAKISFASRTYYLKDLLMTSAGYYFLGLMYQQTYTNENSYFIRNTLKSVLELGSDNQTYVKHDVADGDITYKTSGVVPVFDNTMYSKMYRSRYDGDSVQSSQVQMSSGTYDNNNSYGESTNFGSLKYNNKTLYIKSEQVGSEYYLYVLYNNTKLYVVFYETGTPPKDTISFDKTFMYYHDRDVNGNLLNTYTLRLGSDGKMYYVKDSFNSGSERQIIKPNIGMAVYSVARNTYDFAGKEEITSIVEKKIYNTREFTLFAHWEKRDITSTIVNGNNGVGGNSGNSNPGLAGWYSIDAVGSDNSGAATSNSVESVGQSDAQISTSHPFNSTVDYEFLPFYNGRYMSEMVIEFNTLVETNYGLTSRFEQVHNTITIRFTFVSATHALEISEFIWNGVNFTSSLSIDTSSGLTYYKFASIPELSIIDYYSMNYNSSSALRVYNYKTTSHDADGRKNMHPIQLKLQNVLTSVKFTCKFSIQTYLVEVYNVVAIRGQLGKSGGEFAAAFSSLESMWNSSNKAVANRGSYGVPYISNINYNNTIASTISINTAMSQTKSYNVPYYYYMGSSASTAADIEGLNYIYGSDFKYKSGTTTSDVAMYKNSLGNILAQMTDNGNYKTYATKFNDDDIDNGDVWFTYNRFEGNKVILDSFGNNAIFKDTTIYGFFTEDISNMRVQFYYWDNDKNNGDGTYGGYVQYLNNEDEYINKGDGAGFTDKIVGSKITQLPSPSIAPWYGSADPSEANKKFIGYVAIDDTLENEILLATIDANYRSQLLNQKTSYTATTGDLASHIYIKSGDDLTTSPTGTGLISVDPFAVVTDIFKYRITVVGNNKYFTKTMTRADGTKFQILDAVRANIIIDVPGYGQITIQKDLKMLNAEYTLRNTITYAIPLYEDVDFEYTAYSYDSANKVLSLSSLSSMVKSNVFELNDKYTIFHDPKNARIAVSSKANITLSEIDALGSISEVGNKKVTISNQGIYTFEKETRSYSLNDGTVETYDFGFKQFTVSSGTYYIFLYYVDAANKAFYKTDNSIKLQASSCQSNPSGLSNIDFEILSPLEIQLSGEYATTYQKSVAEIEASLDTSNTLEVAKAYNRKLVIYVLMQLLQSGYVDILNNDSVDYYYSATYASNGTDVGHVETDVEEIIKAINLKVWGRDEVVNRLTNIFGLYRMAYSIAYHFVSTSGVNSGNVIGLQALYGKGEENKKATSALTYDNIDTIMGENFLSDGTNGLYNLKPGDFLKDDKTKNGGVLIRDAAAGTTRYSYTTAQSGNVMVSVSLQAVGNPTTNVHRATITIDTNTYYIYADQSQTYADNFWGSNDVIYCRLSKDYGVNYTQVGEATFNASNYKAGDQNIIVKLVRSEPVYNMATAYIHVNPESESDNTQLAMYLYANRNGTTKIINTLCLLMPNMSISGKEIVYKNSSGNTVAEGESGVQMKFVTRGQTLDRVYNDYEKYDRYKFELATSGLYELDPLASTSFTGITTPASYSDPAGTSGGKQITRKTYSSSTWVEQNSEILVLTGYTGGQYVLKTEYDEAYTEASNKAVADANTAGTAAADNWATSNANTDMYNKAEEARDTDYENRLAAAEQAARDAYDALTDEEKAMTSLNDMIEEEKDKVILGSIFDFCDYVYRAERLAYYKGTSTYTSLKNSSYNTKYNEVFEGYMEEAVAAKCIDRVDYDASAYSSQKGYVVFADVKYVYYNLTSTAYYYRIKDPTADASDYPDGSDDKFEYYPDLSFDEVPGYENHSGTLAYWLRLGSGTGKPNTVQTNGNLAVSSSYIYTRYESFFDENEWYKV